MDENIFNMIDAESYPFRDGSNFFVQANFNSQYKERAIELIKNDIINNSTRYGLAQGSIVEYYKNIGGEKKWDLEEDVEAVASEEASAGDAAVYGLSL